MTHRAKYQERAREDEETQAHFKNKNKMKEHERMSHHTREREQESFVRINTPTLTILWISRAAAVMAKKRKCKR
jgi:hypothetical protein